MNEDVGAKITDLNFGCFYEKDVIGLSGSYLLQVENLASKNLYETVRAVKITVTLKAFMDWNDESLNAPV